MIGAVAAEQARFNTDFHGKIEPQIFTESIFLFRTVLPELSVKDRESIFR
jgi:hypothetical protein